MTDKTLTALPLPPLDTSAALAVDRQRVRRAGDARAAHYRDYAYLPDLITGRLLERLAFVRLDPARIVDVGNALGPSGAALTRQYRHASTVVVDPCQRRAALARADLPRWRNRRHITAGDAGSLPLADHSADLVFSALGLAQHAPLVPAIADLRRLLRPGGVLMLAALGPASFREARLAFAAGGLDPFGPFVDLHDLGDMMLKAGLADVVVESELLDVSYADLDAMLRELRGVGGINARPDRRRGLTGRGRWQAVRDAAAAQSTPLEAGGPARQPVTVEVVYAHAWAVERAAAQGSSSAGGSVDVALPAR